jgi:hypothetical protein
MRKGRRFRFTPSESWVLEDRVVLSHAGSAGIVAMASNPPPLRASIHGALTTVVPGSLGGAQAATIVGSTTVAGVGTVSLAGRLSENGSLPPQFARTAGVVVVNSPVGLAVIVLSGPAGSLAPTKLTTERLTFTVATATGALAPYIGARGIANLTLIATCPAMKGPMTCHGAFALTATL